MKKTLVYLMFGFIICSMFSSCVTSKVEAEVITFSKDVEKHYKPYNLEKESKTLEKIIINARDGVNETAEYVAVEKGLKRTEKIAKRQRKAYNLRKIFTKEKNPKTKYYMILLTDGLDNVSTEIARKRLINRKKYDSGDQFAADLNGKMDSLLNKKYLWGLFQKENENNTFQSWPIMFYGTDIEESGYDEEDVRKILRPLAGAQNTYVPEPIVDSSLENIKETFRKNFIVTSYTFQIPKGYLNKRIKMTFNPDTSLETTLEADFVREKRFLKKERYLLKNIKTTGELSLDYSKDRKHKNDEVVISEVARRGVNSASFTIDNLRINIDEPYSVADAKQEFEDNNKFRVNSEFDPRAGQKQNAYIMFVLDTSRSLGAEAPNVKKTAYDIINIIKEEVLGE